MPTAKQTMELHARIVRLHLGGKSHGEIAAECDTSKTTVKRALNEWRADTKTHLAGEDPMEVVIEQIEGFRSLRSRLADVVEGIVEADNTSAFVGAIRQMADLRQREIQLRQEVGLLPRNLGQLSLEMDAHFVATEIVRVFNDYGVPVEAQKEIARVMGRAEVELGPLNAQ